MRNTLALKPGARPSGYNGHKKAVPQPPIPPSSSTLVAWEDRSMVDLVGMAIVEVAPHCLGFIASWVSVSYSWWKTLVNF